MVSINGSPDFEGRTNCLRQIPKLSKAPECSSDSNDFLLTVPDILSTKSKISLKGPFCLLSFTIALTTLSPNPLIPPKPNRMSPFLLTLKNDSDSLISGLRTFILPFLQSAIIFLISSALPRLAVRLAAWNSDG